MRSVGLAVVAVGALVVSGFSAVGLASPVLASEASTAVASDGEYAPDVATASSLAASEGHAVAVDAMTNPQERTSVLPDGSFQYEHSTLPVRVKQSGVWTAVDETLTSQSGWLAPAVSAAPVRFSAGGSNILDEVQTPSGAWVTETWPYGTLPAPAVDGKTATYADVLPGVDLKLTATETGMSSVYVVKSSTAALGTVLKTLHVNVGGAKVSEDANGTFTADPGSGQPVRTGAPLWWDSAHGGDATSPGGDDPMRPVVASLASTGPSMDVGATLGASSVTYPVFVDPDWSSGDSFWWYTDKAYPTTSYSNVSILRVGIYAQYQSDMFFEFPIGALAGKVIQSAQLATTQTEIDACPTNAISIETYGWQVHGFTWNQEQSWTGQWGGVLDTQTPGSCSNTTASVPVGWNVTNGVKQKLGQQIVQFGIHSTSSAQSRRHFAPGATLTVTYDTPPNTPTSPTFVTPVRSCSTNSAAPVLFNGTQTVRVQVNQTDPDPGNVADNFYVQDFTTNTQTLHYGTALQAQGNISWSFSASGLTEGHVYGWWARGSDYVVDGANPSPTCYFKIDDTKPAAPALSPPSPLPAMALDSSIQVPVSAGSGSDAVGVEYWFAYDSVTSPAVSAPALSYAAASPGCGTISGNVTYECLSAGSVTLTVAPVDNYSTLWVATYDAAGNVSTAVPVLLANSPTSPASEPTGAGWDAWAPGSPMTSPIPDMNTTANVNLTLGSALSLTATDTVTNSSNTTVTVPVLSFSGSAGAGTVANTPTGTGVDTTKSFSAAAWVKPTSNTSTGTVIAQSGTTNSGFTLKDVNQHMQFCVQPQGVTAPPACVTATDLTPAGQWSIVVGIWDAANKQLRVTVGAPSQVTLSNRVTAVRTLLSGETSAAGPVTVGSAQTSGAEADVWNGEIAAAYLFQEPLDSYALSNITSQFG